MSLHLVCHRAAHPAAARRRRRALQDPRRSLDSKRLPRAHRDRARVQRAGADQRSAASASSNGSRQQTRITKLFAFDGLRRVDIESAAAGDIVCLAGIEDITIGETVADPEQPVPIQPIAVDEPTVSMIFGVNTSPFAGREASSSRRASCASAWPASWWATSPIAWRTPGRPSR